MFAEESRIHMGPGGSGSILHTLLSTLLYSTVYCIRIRPSPSGTPLGKRVYLTVYTELSPNMTVYQFRNHKANDNLIISLTNSPNTP